MNHIALRTAPARKADLHPSNDPVLSESALDAVANEDRHK
jgi:hypothetical protein